MELYSVIFEECTNWSFIKSIWVLNGLNKITFGTDFKTTEREELVGFYKRLNTSWELLDQGDGCTHLCASVNVDIKSMREKSPLTSSFRWGSITDEGPFLITFLLNKHQKIQRSVKTKFSIKGQAPFLWRRQIRWVPYYPCRDPLLIHKEMCE